MVKLFVVELLTKLYDESLWLSSCG